MNKNKKNWFPKINHRVISRNQNQSLKKSSLKNILKHQSSQNQGIILTKIYKENKNFPKNDNYKNNYNRNNKHQNIFKYFQVMIKQHLLKSTAFLASSISSKQFLTLSKSEPSLLSPVTAFPLAALPLFNSNILSRSAKLLFKLLNWNGRYQCSNLLQISTTPFPTTALPPSSYNCSLRNNGKTRKNNNSMYVLILMILLLLGGIWNGNGERNGLLLVEGVSTSTVLRPGTGNLSARLPRTSASQLNSGGNGAGNVNGNAGYKLMVKSLNGTHTRNGNLRTR